MLGQVEMPAMQFSTTVPSGPGAVKSQAGERWPSPIPDPKKPLCVVTFLTIINWFATSVRSGVWTFYEAARPNDIELTLQFLE